MLSYRILLAAVVLLWTAGCGGPDASSPSGTPPPDSYRVQNYTIHKADVSTVVRGASITSTFFQAAKARALVGRLFREEEYGGGGHNLVVVSNAIWKRLFGGGPGLIGQVVELNGKEFTVVGIMPRDFGFPPDVDLWIPQD